MGPVLFKFASHRLQQGVCRSGSLRAYKSSIKGNDHRSDSCQIRSIVARSSEPQAPVWKLTDAGSAVATDAGSSAAANDDQLQRRDVRVVLVEPQIPQNTGNVARSCAAAGVMLHLVQPLGFEIDDRKLKRAGLDYWGSVCVDIHDSWQAFYQYWLQQAGPKRLVGYSVYASTYYAGPEFQYHPGDWLLFGAETHGLPLEAHRDIEASGGVLVKIPIVQTHVRSLNLAVSAGIGLFEAVRQLDDTSRVNGNGSSSGADVVAAPGAAQTNAPSTSSQSRGDAGSDGDSASAASVSSSSSNSHRHVRPHADKAVAAAGSSPPGDTSGGAGSSGHGDTLGDARTGGRGGGSRRGHVVTPRLTPTLEEVAAGYQAAKRGNKNKQIAGRIGLAEEHPDLS